MTDINTHIEQRDLAIRAAHTYVSSAIRHLDTASVHATEIDDRVHVEHLCGIIKQLSAAREPLTEHIDWLEKQVD